MHSPRACIPGGGWIDPLLRATQSRRRTARRPAGESRGHRARKQSQIVYYWFQQRGRILTNEYLVKWFIFWDALTRNRTDGALVRLAMPIAPGADEAVTDLAAARFAAQVMPTLARYVPD